MQKPIKLKSGRWRIQVSTGKGADGKYHRKSITADTKAECLYLAATYQESARSDLTGHCIDQYIEAKRSVLSPSTIRSYEMYRKHAYESIENVPLSDLTNHLVQRWISEYSVEHSPKSVKNCYGLLSSTMKHFDMKPLNVALPKRPKEIYRVPTKEQVERLITESSEDLRRAIILGAYCSLRRGEACALTRADMDLNTGRISINKDMVMDSDRNWIVKQPKTYASYRTVTLPKGFICEFMDVGEQVIACNPNALSRRFERLTKRLGYNMTYHSLRHFFASECHSMGISDRAIERMGGWQKNSTVLRVVYQDVTEAESQRLADEIASHFSVSKS